MILRCVCWSIFLCLAVKAQVKVEEQGYQNLLISFAPNVPSDNGEELVLSLQDLLEETSSVLQTAIGIRIASATFLLPPSWSTEKFENITISPASSDQTGRRPDVNVDATEQSPFGKQPVTLQHGGCGVSGHQIILPLDFLSSTEEYPKGKLLAREWLKYRYGVFEENGFRYDPLYPEYYRIPGSSDIIVTECTDSNVTYTFKKPGEDEACDMDSVADFGYCRTHPDDDNVTSSLMYFHKGLRNMEHICGKDDHPHQNTLRSKQNALCSGQSIWDVVNQSDDFKTPQQPLADPVPEPIQFSYVQESKPRFIVLLEDSENLHDKQEQIRFALRRFYYDLPPKSKLAIYTYNTEVGSGPLPFGELATQEERPNLVTIADFLYPPTDICTSCGLAKATQTLLEDSEGEKGSILLITASSLDNVPTFDEKLKDSGICLDVMRFQGEDDPVDESYAPLEASFSSCFYYNSNRLKELENFKYLNSFLKNRVPESNDDFEIKTVISEQMSGIKSLTIPHDATASLYTLWLAKAFAVGSIKCTAGDDDVTLKDGTKGTDIASFTFNPVENDVSCKVGSVFEKTPILTQVQMTTQKGHYFSFDTWFHDVSTEKEQLPIKIYAKIYFGGYPVNNAKVTTVVTSANNQEEIVKMLDNGRGDPDITQNDGIYSGYFTGFLSEGEYQIKVKIDDNEAQAKIGKEYPELMSATCCGSKVIIQDEGVPAFQMEKLMVYNAKNKRPDDGYPPSRIVDLQVGEFNHSHFLVLTWTAPGGGKAGRYALKLFQNRDSALNNFDTTGQELNASSMVPGEYGKTEGFVLHHDDLDKDTAYYVTMRSWNEFNKASEISNLVEFYLPKDVEETSVTETSPTPGGITDDESTKRAQARKRTIEIVVGVLAGIVVLCILVYLAIYFFVQKPKRREEKAKARKKAENGGGGPRTTPSGPAGQIGLNSIPADVIIKHHNEVQEAKSKHKDPPIFKEENLDSMNSSPDLPENTRRNNKAAQYTMVQKAPEGTASNSSQQDPSKSPKRMTVV